MRFKGVEKGKERQEKSSGNFSYQAKKRILASFKNDKLRREASLEKSFRFYLASHEFPFYVSCIPYHG